MPEQEAELDMTLCPTCHGTTRMPGYESMYCATCGGSGWSSPETAAKLGKRPEAYPEGFFDRQYAPQSTATHLCEPLKARIASEKCFWTVPNGLSYVDADSIERYNTAPVPGGLHEWWMSINGGEYHMPIDYCPFCGAHIREGEGMYFTT